MFDINDIPGMSENNDNGNEPSKLDKLAAAATLTAIGHALTDYVRSSEDAFQGLCLMMRVTDSERVAEIRASIDAAHDSFLGMSVNMARELMMSAVFSPEGGEYISAVLGALGDDGDDGEPDIDITSLGF